MLFDMNWQHKAEITDVTGELEMEISYKITEFEGNWHWGIEEF